jgi:hemerythrin-like domain-containing protein
MKKKKEKKEMSVNFQCPFPIPHNAQIIYPEPQPETKPFTPQTSFISQSYSQSVASTPTPVPVLLRNESAIVPMKPPVLSTLSSNISMTMLPMVDLQTNFYIDHGLIRRCLLAYEKLLSLAKSNSHKGSDNLVLLLIRRVALIWSQYIHPVHEEAQEKYMFKPALEAQFEPEKINLLWNQHDIARGITNQILVLLPEKNTTSKTMKLSKDQWCELSALLIRLIEMYNYHLVVEDTIIFPGFYQVVDRKALHRTLFNDYIDKVTKPSYEAASQEIQEIEKLLGLSLWNTTPNESDLQYLGVKYRFKTH